MNRPHTSSSRAKALLAFASALALVLGVWAARELAPQQATLPVFTAGTAFPAPRPLVSFNLTDHRGQAFKLERLQGTWTFLFFGYTHCPDVCPTTLTTLNSVTNMLRAADPTHPPPQVVFVSIDPARDTVARLAEYVPYFNKDFLGVTGSGPQVDAFAQQLNILHMRGNEPSTKGNYTMDHTASLLLIDPQARFSAIFSAPHVATNIAQDFSSLRKYYEGQQ